MGSGEGISFPSWGSRAERSLAELQRSAAFRGQSPREVREPEGEETHPLWKEIHFFTRLHDRPRLAFCIRERSAVAVGCRRLRCSRVSLPVRRSGQTIRGDEPIPV